MKIFISYRHSEAVAATARLIHDRLEEYNDSSDVFFDSGSLALGDAFPSVLADEIASCRVFLVLIDPHWLASTDRLNNPDDWVRRELEQALQRLAAHEIRVIPVLLLGAAMPSPSSLPKSIALLAGLRAGHLHQSSFDDDLTALALRIDRWTPERLVLWLQARRRATLWAAVGGVLLFSASLVALFDTLNLETGMEALTLAWADAFDDPLPDDKLITVVIDKSTEQHLQKTFDKSWRRQHAQLISRLADAGASVVAFDLYLEGESPHDAALTAAATTARNEGKSTAVIFGSNRASAAPVLPALVAESGFLCIGTELEWARLASLYVRRPLPPDSAAPGGARRWQYLASLGARAVAPRSIIRTMDMEQLKVAIDSPTGEPSDVPFSRKNTVTVDQACTALSVGDEVAQRILRLTRLERLREPARRRRYQDLLGPAAADDQAQYGGKIVLIGSELEARESRPVFRGLQTENRFGHEIHADVINTLLHGVDIRPVPALPQFLMMLLMGLLGLLGRFWPPLATTAWGLIFAGAVVALYLAISTWLCAQFYWLLSGVYHLGAFGFAFWVSGLMLRRKGLLKRTGV